MRCTLPALRRRPAAALDASGRPSDEIASMLPAPAQSAGQAPERREALVVAEQALEHADELDLAVVEFRH